MFFYRLVEMLHSEPAMIGAAVFRSLTEILSTPVTFLVKRNLFENFKYSFN